MNKIIFPAIVLVCASTIANAQTPSESVIKKLGMYVFPAKNQTKEVQAKDEEACYKWGVEQSGIDPVNPPKVDTAKTEKGPNGAAVKGAAKGAAAGAAIGAIAGDAGEGAAIGAVAGGVGARRANKKGQQQQEKQANAAATAENENNINSFKKAFTACLEGKGYTVK